MNIIQKEETINFRFDKTTNLKRLLDNFKDKQILRFSVVKSSKKNDNIICDYAVAENILYPIKNIFEFNKRQFINNSQFNAVMIIPTGIGAELGGDSGDGNVAARLIGSVVDNLITHPNVVNAADINEMTPNTLYVEGSVLNRFILGNIGLCKSKGNKILLLYDNLTHDGREINNTIKSCSINAASSLRVTLGNNIDVCPINKPPKYDCFFNDRNMAIGSVYNIEYLIDIINKYKNDYDCFALHTIMNMEDKYVSFKYFNEESIDVNPWGGLEAMISHTISNVLDIPTAHAPMLADGTFDYEYGIVNPTKCPETLSKTELYCILKGLSYSPKIITNKNLFNRNSVLTNEDISCLIIPDRCINLPILAALEQDIPVITISDNKNIMDNDIDNLPWKEGKYFKAKNYLEVVGYIECLKQGIFPSNLKRPIKETKIIN